MDTTPAQEPDTLDRYAMKGFCSALMRIRLAAGYYGASQEQVYLQTGYSALAQLHRHHDPIDPSVIPDPTARDAFATVKSLLSDLDRAYGAITPAHRFREVQQVLDLTARIGAASEAFATIVRERRRTAAIHRLWESATEVHEPDVTE